MNDEIPHHLLHAYYAGTADEQQVAALSAWIEESPEHAAYLSAMGWLDVALKQQLQNEPVDRLSAQERRFLDRVDPEAWDLILNSVLSSKQQHETLPQSFDHGQPPCKPEPSMGLGELCSVAGYLAMNGLRTKAGVIGSIAAVLVLGALLYVSIMGLGTTPLAPNTAGQTTGQTPAQTPTEREASTANIVAILTAARNAKWSVGSDTAQPTINDGLRAGDRLTLTQGSAEITTMRGAVAIVEAPCTIEMIDSPNALRLVSGKLVGVCETESSKGFLVRTPHMDVTDLGTRFGVDASNSVETQVHVFAGEVVLSVDTAEQGDLGGQRVLIRGEAATYDHASDKLVKAKYEPERFARNSGSAYQSPDYVLAYWRFDQGRPGVVVPISGPDHKNPKNLAAQDYAGRQNHLYAYAANSSPAYTDRAPALYVPQTGQLNTGSLDDTRPPAANSDVRNLYTLGRRANFTAGQPLESVVLTQWTIEASVMPTNLAGKQSYVCREGPGRISNPILMLGALDGRFFVEFYTQAGELVRVQADAITQANQWTHLAATYDGSALSLFAKRPGDETYVLLGKTAHQGDTRQETREWNVGGSATQDDTLAVIDEVRISDQALSINQLLFSEPTQ